MEEKMKELLAQMTLEEKASLCSGLNFWYMKGVERLGINSVMVTDGPHGLRKQAGNADHLGINESVPATCFPPAVTAASGWNPQNLYEMGAAIGEEALQEDVAVVLGPGTNIKRSPLCGRNFEYFSEDPFLSGEMAAAWVNGVQSKGVGTSLKHFAANNQEKARLSGNSIVDERTLREIYLSAFERTVKKAQPWTVMCSYNRVNGVYSCENPWLLTEVLREEWGFEGLVMTDWGAMDDRVEALKAGLELEMPGPSGYNDNKIVQAVQEGRLDETVLDRAVEKLLALILKSQEAKPAVYDITAHHALARYVAAQSAVLLKNGGMVPLKQGKEYAVVGAFAENPRYQGAGSSKINPHFVDSPLEELRKLGMNVAYAQGYSLESDEPVETLLEEAAALARGKDGVIVFVGLPDSYESEGFDRSHLNMPKSHTALIETVSKVNSHVTVVLMCGSAVMMPWEGEAESILLSYLGGEAAGGACADVLTGKVNPSGKLAETFPLHLEDTPCYGNFAAEGLDVEYREGILVGYRYYDWAKKEVAFPFGYGLSYTDFTYDGMEVNWEDQTKKGVVKVTVTNTGSREGREVVQLYIGKEDSVILRAPRELKGFASVTLAAGETKTVEIPLEERSFTYYNSERKGWEVEDGEYKLYAAASSRDLRLEQTLTVNGQAVSAGIIKDGEAYLSGKVMHEGGFAATQEQFEALFGSKLPFVPRTGRKTVNTCVGEALSDEKGKALFEEIIENYKSLNGGEGDVGRMMMSMLMDMPLRCMAMFGLASMEEVEKRVEEWND